MTAFQAMRPETSAAGFGAACDTAIVKAWEDGGLVVQRGGLAAPARCAVSCLLRPEPGDLVLVAEAQGTLWVLALLDSVEARPMRIEAPGDLAIAATGAASLEADDIRIAAAQKTSLASEEIAIEARRGHVLIETLLHTGQEITAHVGRLRHIGTVAETVVGMVVTKAKQSLRFIEGSDRLQSADIDHRATRSLSLRGDITFLAGKTIAKVNADQIHMG